MGPAAGPAVCKGPVVVRLLTGMLLQRAGVGVFMRMTIPADVCSLRQWRRGAFGVALAAPKKE
jgi:hypothetical protein